MDAIDAFRVHIALLATDCIAKTTISRLYGPKAAEIPDMLFPVTSGFLLLSQEIPEDGHIV